MSWPVPTPGPWGTGVPMTPDMNMGSYSAEQWAAVQQQNWQQWAQWQQQYSQWQSQYGEKYAQQMQAMQSLGGLPPLPTNAAPPVPAPPPDQPPPPPPPHENNQPLYGSTSKAPAPVPPPTQNRQTNPPNLTAVNTTGNNQRSYGSQAPPSAAAATTPAPPAVAVDSEALKKLAEEEKLFDIQFQKWEEEIDKWRRENVNHPDKQAYKEYEEKFEACRAQLLERRQQMKLKRARLTNSPLTGNALTSVPPPTLQNAPSNSYAQNKPQSYINKQDQSRMNPNAPYQQSFNKHYNDSAPPVSYSKGDVEPQDRYESYQDGDNYRSGGDYSGRDNYSGNNDYSGNDNYSDHNNYSGNDNYSANDKYSGNDYPSVNKDGNYPTDNSFLPTSGASKNIPGLDLVPDTDKGAGPQQDIIDITGEQERANYNKSQQQIAQPDYSKISKGINNILGDEKIMNILSMVRGQTAPTANPGVQSSSNMPHNNQNNQMNSPWNKNENNQQSNDNQLYNENQLYDNNQQYNNDAPYGNRPNNMLYNNRQQPNYPTQQNQGQTNRFPPNQRRMYGDHPPNQNQDQYYDENEQYRMQNLPPRNDQPPIRHNALGPRPLMDISMSVNENQYKGPLNRGIPENVRPASPPRRKWIEEPLFTPTIIVEYEHKPLRVKARDFIEPVHTFDYNHISKDSENKKKDFEREADELFLRKPRWDSHPPEYINQDRYTKDLHSRDFERRIPREREEIREDYRIKSLRNEYEERRRPDNRYEDIRRDDRYVRRDDGIRDRERDRDWERERQRDCERDRDLFRERPRERELVRRDDSRVRSRSRDKDTRKREHSRERFESDAAKKTKEVNNVDEVGDPKHTVMIDDLLEPPGREMRPSKIVIILRGPPGSGKSYLAKLIRDKEAEYGGTVRIMSIDDYFMQEGEVEEKDPTTGKMVKKPTLKYEYDEKLEETYLNSLNRAFKRSLTDGYFSFLIYDAVNEHTKRFADIWNSARQSGFQVYVCSMEIDSQVCYKRNIHNRTLEDIQVICSRFFPTPSQYIQLDATTLLQSAAITEVHMEDVEDDVVMEDAEETEVESVFTSKWEKMDDATQLARLDGTSKPLRPSQLSMEDYLQLDDWKPNKAAPGKKTVRWADIEERRQQEKMRAIGFVVGQTDWNRMTDPTMGSSALTQTKYIERVRRT